MVVDYLETHDDEQTTIHKKMSQFLPSEIEPFRFTHMKACLKNHLGGKIVIAEITGKKSLTSTIVPRMRISNLKKSD